ncbi:MAG: helix-turn-helix domain-containing protein [Nitrospirae bacterium]|nr:helix-turn-helix domain-containing protein [Nitrospirota bacterium]MBI3595144.1 helix-turn-helix domain-containing protein [Nitrospirota bacterium]
MMELNQVIFQKRIALFSLVGELHNVSEACKKIGVSRQYFYELRKDYQKQGEEALKVKDRKKPNLKNRVAPEIEKAVVSMAFQNPAYGQVRVALELNRSGVLISPGGVRSIWKRNGLENYQKRISRLKERFLIPITI